MKRITIYIAHLLVLVLTGCDKTVLEFPEKHIRLIGYQWFET